MSATQPSLAGTMGGPAFQDSELHVVTPQTEHIQPEMTHPGKFLFVRVVLKEKLNICLKRKK